MKDIKYYIELLEQNGFTCMLLSIPTINLHQVSKYGESVILFLSDFNDNVVEYCEDKTTFKGLNNDHIQRYAFSLLHHNIKKNYKQAYKESLRCYKKEYQGFVEPMVCPFISDELLRFYLRERKLKRIMK